MPRLSNAAFALICALTIVIPVAPAEAAAPVNKDPTEGKIKKCKDAEGRWHYGDRAADECAKSKIVEITEKGTQRRTIAAPLTKEELAERERRKDELTREEERKKEQERQDQLLLTTYANEDDINFIRDRKVAQIESQIKATEQTLTPMRAALERMEKQAEKEKSAELAQQIERTKVQITRHEAVIVEKKKEQEELRQKYAADLLRYRVLRSGKAAAAAETQKP